jgi:TM2 domain-containing membrane protein YozV
MKKLFMLTLVGAMFMSISSMASAEKYRIDDSAVEAAFSATKLITSNLTNINAFGTLSTDAVMAEKNPWVAAVLAWLVGGLGIHRVYLGSKGILVFGYIITVCGIFGIVPLIDLIVILINNDDISKYIGNNKYFMW